MASIGEKAVTHIQEITECPICMSAFTDPRMLPCIHTFCLECLERTSEAEQKKKPGDKMPCPLCRKEFTVPKEGIAGLQRNFFMENLLEFSRSTTVQRNDPTLKIDSERNDEIKRIETLKFCGKHAQKPLDYYCSDCKKIVCVSCFVESHKSHDCKDVNTVDDEFRQRIEKYACRTSNYADEILSLKKCAEIRNADFLRKLESNEKAIIERSIELKEMLDGHTKSLLDELSLIKSNRLKEMENQMEEIKRYCTILSSFETYCNELTMRGSASDICSSVDQIIGRADELGKDHEAFIGRPLQSVDVTFQATDLGKVLQTDKDNFVGNIKEITTQLENYAIVVGLNDGETITQEVVRINLHRPNDVSNLEQIPTAMDREAAAAVYCNTMYVTGIGENNDEIWKYSRVSGWKKCASLVQGRRRHCAAFIDEVLYVCGGFVDSNQNILDSVEAYNALTDKCTAVGKLVHSVESCGNCVPFKDLLYIFGGSDKDDNNVNHVQVYNTKDNMCTLASKPMPRPHRLMRAVVWETSVVLVGLNACFIFDFEKDTWQERNQFKTNVGHFGLILEYERVFVIGGATLEEGEDGTATWKCTDDVRYVPLRNILHGKPIPWQTHAKLSQPSLIQGYEKLTLVSHRSSDKPNACLVQ